MRAYAPIAKRQQGADRLAYNEDDLRRILWQAVDPNFSGTRPATIRLGADIILTRPIKLYPGQYNVTIDGGRQFGIKEARSFAGNGMFQLSDGHTSNFSIINCSFDMPTTRDIFDCTSAASVSDFSVLNCNVSTGFPSARLFSSGITAVDVIAELDSVSSFSVGPSGMVFTGKLRFGSDTGTFPITPVLFDVEYYEQRPVASVVGLLGNVGAGFGTAGPLLSVDIDGGMRMRPASVTLADANPVLTVGDRSVFEITIDNATATGDMDMTAGKTGQIVVLYFLNTATNMRLSDYGNIDVNKNHSSKHPLKDETVTFIWLSSKWREIARSENN